MKIYARSAVPARLAVAGVLLAGSLLLLFALSRVVQAAGEAFSSPADKTVIEGGLLAITDLQISGTGDEELNMNLHASGGSLQFGSSSGLTFSGSSYGTDLQFSGTRSAINAALLTLQYYSDDPDTYTIEATLGGGDGDVYNPVNQHAYQVIAAGGEGVAWGDAKAAAEGMTYKGVPGYLATITTEQEQNFVIARISQDGWIGATDADNEGQWKWVTGPEVGSPSFWTGQGTEGSVTEGNYANWNQAEGAAEPNNDTGSGEDGEDCAEIRFTGGAAGRWNDRTCEATNAAYVVEFGTPTDLPMVASTNFQVTVNEAPEIAVTTMVPADNSKVAPTDTLSITFNQPMESSEGYVEVYNAADDSLIEEFGTWDGATADDQTFTFTLANELQPGNYYVKLTDSGFQGVDDYYHGFDDKTTWNFTVIDGGSTPEVEDAAPNDGDGNNDGTPDSEQTNVTSLVNTTTGKYVTLEADPSCDITGASMQAEASLAVADGKFQYPYGLIDFTLECGTPGYTATVKQYYHGASDHSFTVRKYNPTTKQYTAIDGASVSKQTIGGNAVLVATYSVKDGGSLDLDGTEDGNIHDPAGLAQATSEESSLADTGSNRYGVAFAALMLLVAGGGILVKARFARQIR